MKKQQNNRTQIVSTLLSETIHVKIHLFTNNKHFRKKEIELKLFSEKSLHGRASTENTKINDS